MKILRSGMSIPELVAGLAAITVLLGIALPTIGGVRIGSGEAGSIANLRTIGAAHTVYAADWGGRQVTWVDDEIVGYGIRCAAFSRYLDENGFPHPPVALGWGRWKTEDYRYFAYRLAFPLNCANAHLTVPINFRHPLEYFGSFRLHNSAQFNQYVGGRFYDETFYAPKDTIVVNAIDDGGCFDSPDGFCDTAQICREGIGAIPAWSSYALSPAAMFDPAVMAHDDPDDPDFNGWRNPWELLDGFRSPALTDALYPSLKTHVLEHHWLQDNPDGACNPSFSGTYRRDGECCEPYYFNHAWASRPITLFYDGHVGEVPVVDAVADDERMREENHENWGLWSKDTPWGDDGYLIDYGYDPVETSFHILTTDGIRGRDVLERGVPRPTRGRVSRFAGSPPPRRGPWSTNTAGGPLRWLEPAPDD